MKLIPHVFLPFPACAAIWNSPPLLFGVSAGGGQEYTHPLLKYYRTRGRIPPLSFCVTYLCEIVFFWRAILFIFTVGYKIFLSLAAYYIMNRCCLEKL